MKYNPRFGFDDDDCSVSIEKQNEAGLIIFWCLVIATVVVFSVLLWRAL